MPFCPVCKAEYRAGFELCAPCGDQPLLDELPTHERIQTVDLPSSRAVGVAQQEGAEHLVEVGGRRVDLMRAFVLDDASEMQHFLDRNGISSTITPIPVEFPDGRQRFELRVDEKDVQWAEALLVQQWTEMVAREGSADASREMDIEACPGCGSKVPLDVEECPECGLVVGAAPTSSDEPEEGATPA